MANAPIYTNRTIYDFKSRLSGGGSRSNLFECVMDFPPNAVETDVDLSLDLRFLIKSAALPASNINLISVPFRGRILKLAGDRTFEPWTVTIINDTNFRIRNAFERWSNYMNRHDDNAGVVDPIQYQKDIVIHQLSRGTSGSENLPNPNEQMNILKSYKLYGAFPTLISPIDLSYDQPDTIEEYTVTFEYQWFDSIGNDGTSILGTNEDGTTPATT